MRKLGPRAKWGIAWMGLVYALAIHVIDEMINGFLPFYNSAVTTLRETYSWLVLPTFSYGIWLIMLGIGLTALLVASPLVFEGHRFMRPVAFVFGGLMVLVALGHVVASVVIGYAAPGVYSSPLLFAAAIWLVVKTWRATPAALAA